ncbi:unnamed protein product [Diatraea saccharalis]|uniref:Lipase domain-containing protein n=1 Tax=Diatraea saccharalis TaxID=40085 RepID=A0A9N9R3V4_9NEOP|nr:unnamed protein product [Diatraea saccharalis]
MRRACEHNRPGAGVGANLLFLLLFLIYGGQVTSETLVETLGGFLPPFLRNNIDGLVKTASESCEILPLEILYSRQYTIELPLVDLLECTRSRNRTYRLPTAHLYVKLKPSHQLVLYVPGWWNHPNDESSQAIVKALLNKHPTVLVLDTSLSFSLGYVTSASRVNPLAHLIYDFIKNVHEKGVPLSLIHLIGFSLGSHVVGIAGKLVKKNLNATIGRITALDPAKPCFKNSLDYRLDKNDAEFVQVVHSSAGVLGLEQPVGHVDVYVNGVAGKQPECLGRGITLQCDHAQSWKLYAASVMDETAMMGRRCKNWDELSTGKCNGTMTVIGYSCDKSSRGLYLYKSRRLKSNQNKMKVFNLFDLRTWWN